MCPMQAVWPARDLLADILTQSRFFSNKQRRGVCDSQLSAVVRCRRRRVALRRRAMVLARVLGAPPWSCRSSRPSLQLAS